MQTFIRGRFANEAELIALDELNLYREDFFCLAELQMTKEATNRVQIFSADILFFVYHGIGYLFWTSLLLNDN